MNKNTLKFVAPALTLAAVISSTGCKSSKEEGKGSTDVTRSPAHVSETSTHTTTATITGIDAHNRRVTLTTPDGVRNTYTLGPEVRNFDQLRIGDQVKTTLTEEVAMSLQKGGTPGTSEGTVVSRAPVGGQPGGVIANTRQVTGKIIAIEGRDVTLQFADGTTRKIKAGKDANLTGISPGDTVTARVTEAMAITVEKP